MPIPLPVIANTFRCALRWREASSGQTAVNVIHIQRATSGATAAQAFAALDGAVTAAMWDSAVATSSITDVDITPLDGVTATQTFGTGSPSKWSGSAGGDFTPQNAAVIKLATGVRGRANRGRVFLPFTSEAANGNGLLTSTVANAVGAAWVAFVGSLVALSPSWDLGVASYDRAHAGAGAHFTGVTALECERACGSQRKRQERNR